MSTMEMQRKTPATASEARAEVPSYLKKSQSSEPSIPSQVPPPPKVPIPRQQNKGHLAAAIPRARRACDECKIMKAKCTGKQPCERCLSSGLICNYGPTKREKVSIELNDLSNRLQAHESLLTEIYPRLDKRLQNMVDARLSEGGVQGKYNHNLLEASSTSTTAATTPGIPDYTDEDYNLEGLSQATGHVGQHSDRAWIFSLKQYLDKRSTSSSQSRSDSIASVSYLLDDLDITIKDEVNPFNRPYRPTADRLLSMYFRVVHPSFPILSKSVFQHQYIRYYDEGDVFPRRRWLAVLNLVFAIAAKHAYKDSEILVSEDAHLEFFSRAWRLGMSGNALLTNPDLQQVQVEGLAAFYLLTVEQANRSWRLCGLAITSAYTMGLNMRSESKDISPTSKEIRYRVWWSLYTFETTLCIITGRPTSAADQFCSTPLPIPFLEEDFQGKAASSLLSDNALRIRRLDSLGHRLGGGNFQAAFSSFPSDEGSVHETATNLATSLVPNISLYLIVFITLTAKMRETLYTLYSPGNIHSGRHQIESDMLILDAETDSWYSRLPSEFQFKGGEPPNLLFERQRLSLAFRFYSAKITYSWPALRRSQMLNEEDASIGVHRLAAICVRSACDLLDILPKQPNLRWINDMSPWWCVLHYLMQATAVLLLKMSSPVGAKDGSISSDIFTHLEKSLDWLKDMSRESQAAERAWNLANKLYGQITSSGGVEIPDQGIFSFLLDDTLSCME